MRLTDREKAMLDGRQGEAVRMAMAILLEMGEAIEAEDMEEIVQVHTDSGFYLGEAGLDFVERLAGLGGHVAVPTTMNNTSFDLERGLACGVPPDLFQKVKRVEQAHLKLGAIPSWTCAPYQDGILPRFGSSIAWSESNAIVFANSVFGARTNRTGDLIDICSALTGRYPRFGLYLDENRKADILFDCRFLGQETLADPALYPILGYLAGHLAGNRVIAFEGLPRRISLDYLKGLGAAVASSGSVALFHVIGLTPEAQTRKMCLKSENQLRTIRVMPELLKDMEQQLITADDDHIDWIGFGCPHFSFAEFQELSNLLNERRVHPGLKATVFTSRTIYAWIKELGLLEQLNLAGFDVYTDGCLLLYPKHMGLTGTMMTNSAKAANYIHSQSGLKAAYASLKECVESAVRGKAVDREASWLS